MSRSVRLLVILAAWALPVAWLVAALAAGPSDGTVVWRSPLTSDDRWQDRLVVHETYGDTPLRVGDVITRIGDHAVTDLLTREQTVEGAVGDEVSYGVQRAGAGLSRDLDITVPLTRYPALDAVGENLPVVAAAALAVLAGCVAFWLRPTAAATRAFLAATALAPAALVSGPLGLGAFDVAGPRGLWTHLVGEVAGTVALGLGVVAALTLRPLDGWLRKPAWLLPAAAVPFLGYAAWAGASLLRTDPGAERTQATLSILLPSLAVAAPVAAVVLALTVSRAGARETRVAARLALLALVSGAAARLLLSPALPGDVLLLLVAPLVLAGFVVALAGYRLDEIEPMVRRTAVQGAVAALVGAAFVAVAGAVGRATDVPVGGLVAGGVVALAVLPVAVALQRTVRRLVYGDADLPRTVVSELRRLDATTAPAEALTETLSLLAGRLRLGYAGIEAVGLDGEPLAAEVGRPGGRPPVTVDLLAGGTRLGALELEPAPDRDAFGRGDRRLLEDVGAQVGTVVQAVLANRELRRSRQEIVTAREEERRRLRRDLHDGLGPSLATMAMRLESAHDLIGTDPAQAGDAVAGLADLARDEITEVRRLVDGLRPAALDQLGLVSALRQRAAMNELTAGDRAPVWTLDAEDDLEPLPAAVEVAAYRIALEAVTNAVRHSEARACTVTLRRQDDHLVLHVRDDGRGLADDGPTGVGLGSMRERAEELGGEFAVTSDTNGTLVAVRLPLSVTNGG